MKILFITSNEGKYKEARSVGEKYRIEVEWLNEEYLEPQSKDLEYIARKSAELLVEKVKKPFFIEDSGLFIEALNGFPGPYSSYVFKTIGNEGILKLMEGIKNRKAYFLSVIAFFDGREIKIFKGRVDGVIATEMRGDKGFGFDPIFEYNGRTFAEMGEEKNVVSHRSKALRALFEYVKTLEYK
ncbi:MAG TPA: XTP/dITP diphosphatase [Archaeoglobus profundus]|nr:XTP/dITP diphosphatase [Archaeoglobus profundus]